MLFLILIPLALALFYACEQVFFRGWWYRRIRGGNWQKIWYNRHHHGGYEVWERARPGFDWETIGGRVVDEETKKP
jgi:hypothetical protein